MNLHRTPQPAEVALLVATILMGLCAGFFYTFEISVTHALTQVDDSTYVETFQSINSTVQNPGFGLMFFGAIPMILLAVSLSWRPTDTLGKALLAASVLLYFGTLAITVRANVPLNNELADLSSITSAAASDAREGFENSWNRWNLMRTGTTAASFVALATFGLLRNPATMSSDA